MALPKETQDRIVKDAAAAASKVNDTYREREMQFTNRISFLAGYKEGYIAGAAENEWAQKLVEALERTLVDLNKNINPMLEAMGLHPLSLTAKDIEQTLQQRNAGKEVEKEKEPIIPIAVYKQQGCNVSNSRQCPHCGKELNRDRNLCCECGKKVEI